MNWYKQSQVKIAFKWLDILKGLGLSAASAIALLPLLMRSEATPQKVQEIVTRNQLQLEPIKQELAQATKPQTPQQQIPQQQIQEQPQEQQSPTAFNYEDFTKHLVSVENSRNILYDDKTGKDILHERPGTTNGVWTIGIGHAVGRNPNDSFAVESKRVFNQVFGNSVNWDDLWKGLKLNQSQINALAKYDIDKHMNRARGMFPKFDTYPYYVQKSLLDSIYRGDMGKNTQNLINAGNWAAVPREYINRKDYQNAEKNKMRGVKTRMDRNKNAFLQYAQELGQV